MKDEIFTGIICEKYCSFYKEGKENLCCGAFSFLRNNLTSRELRFLLHWSELDKGPRECDFSTDREIKKLVCDKCDFLVDGCDFREDASYPPCGGYVILSTLLRN